MWGNDFGVWLPLGIWEKQDDGFGTDLNQYLNKDFNKNRNMNRKIEEKNIRKLAKSGKTSLAVTIPRDFIVELGWREKQKVMVKKQGKTIIISDWSQN